jgi:RNA-directed DNA polymerase
VKSTKSFDIPKALVWESYLAVKASKGGPGIDGICVEVFEQNLKDRLYKIWNRLSSGSYFPAPVKQVDIPKADGGTRTLGIPTIEDRIAQGVVKLYLEPIVEPHFHEDSYGFRPGKSALDAVGTTRWRCWRDNWVLDLDIRKFFDMLDHKLVLAAVARFTDCPWVALYVERWLKADLQTPDGLLVPRDSGAPQGGVVSPLLANIFLHLVFDKWMLDNFPQIHFERYADDIVVHCRSRKQLEWIRDLIEKRLARCKLELNSEKTRVVYCRDSSRKEDWSCNSFDFLGYCFRPRSARDREGKFFVSFSPAISPKASKCLRQVIRREWRLRSRVFLNIDSLARWLNPKISGWINYYGRFCRSALHSVLTHINHALEVWAMNKFKGLHRRKTRARKWVRNLARRTPNLFVHWQYQDWMTRAV